MQGRITSSLFAEKDKDAEPRHIRICLYSGKIWVVMARITGGVGLFTAGGVVLRVREEL